MMDFLFFVKTMALTIVLVLLLQIHVGDRSLETHAMGWVQSSAVVEPLHGVKRGAANLVHEVSHNVADFIHNNVNKNKKEDARIKRTSSTDKSHDEESTSERD